MRNQKSIAPERPFFLYYALGAVHAPHHPPKAWAEKYRGKFAHGQYVTPYKFTGTINNVTIELKK